MLIRGSIVAEWPFWPLKVQYIGPGMVISGLLA